MLRKTTIPLIICLAVFATLGFAQNTVTTPVDQLKAQIQEQQRQIQQLQSALAKQQQLLEQLAKSAKPNQPEEKDKQDQTSQQQAAAQQPSQQAQPSAASAGASQPASPLAAVGNNDDSAQPASPASRFPHGIAQVASLRPVIPSAAFALPAQTTPSPGAKAVPVTQASDSIELAQGKVRIGALLYADWADYYKTGFGPQFLTQINPAGAGNDGYNTFEINRTYLNLFFSPNDNITFRLTPNIYRQFAGVNALKYGSVTGIGASANENLTFRLKYAYVDIKNLFKDSPTAKGVTLTLGQLQNPLVDWEENLWSYRYIALTPWNYLSLSSTQTGVSLHGPLQSNGKTYLDFNAGIYTQASFHAYEQAESKQLMARATVYPFGSAGNYQGLGITGFYDYARSNAYPETARTIGIYRGVAMIHYATKNNMSNIAFEYDFGRNAFSSGNLFSGSGPIDAFGLGTSPYAGMTAVIKAIQGTDRTKQQGYNVFGHLQLGKSPFQLFGWFEKFQPNTEAKKNPADFDRIIAGVQYRANKNLRFAFDFQNLIFTHGQFTIPSSDLVYFSPPLAGANPDGIPNVVPPDIQAFFINMEFSF
jgi:hypothetical protein